MRIFRPTLLIIAIFSSIVLYSQDNNMVDYTWSHYHVKFSLPDNFHVIINNDQEFRAGTDDQQFLFQLFGNPGCACSDTNLIKTDLIGAAQANNLYNYEKYIYTYSNENGLAQSLLYGTKINSQGRETYMSIWVLEHPLYHEQLRVFFSYVDDIQGLLLNMAFQLKFKAVD